MLTEKRVQKDLAEAITDDEAFKLKGDLEAIYNFLEGIDLTEPLKKHFSKDKGRPSISLDTFIRMMILKHYYNIGYKTLVEEVTHRIDLRYFCKIGLKDKVPDDSTLKKLAKKIGGEGIEEINKIVIKAALGSGKIKRKAIRIDTTVVESNISYPTDVSLIYKVVKGVERFAEKIKEDLKDCKVKVAKRSRKVKGKLLEVIRYIKGKGKKSKGLIKEKVNEMVQMAKKSVKESKRAIEVVKQKVKGAANEMGDRIERFLSKYEDFIERSDKLIEQSEKIVKGERVDAANRIVSLYDTDARAIVKGGINKEVKFGYKLSLSTVKEGIVTGYEVVKGNPSDKKLFKEAIKKNIEVFGRAPDACATDRGLYSKKNEDYAKEVGIKRVCLPKPGRKSQERKKIEESRWFKELKRFRAGIEANISLMKRKFGLRRSLILNIKGAYLWVSLSILAYNAHIIANKIMKC